MITVMQVAAGLDGKDVHIMVEDTCWLTAILGVLTQEQKNEVLARALALQEQKNTAFLQGQHWQPSLTTGRILPGRGAVNGGSLSP